MCNRFIKNENFVTNLFLKRNIFVPISEHFCRYLLYTVIVRISVQNERGDHMDYSYDYQVGQRIRTCRKEQKLTQDQLAAKLQLNGYDLTRGTIAKIESGQRHIYLYELKAIVEILKIPFDELLL